ncbi:hypothetical protein LARV_03909 [Longilinea arvoryzae]|uniref:Zinc ribbon domain-containing protein n=1 Tax=Longilinea arvoryzae TaxID=360412 RepID=A0A0K8MXY5_9CHLR|nr:Ig-like domain-containing protein [Longilinea arvoryzae]GAP16113.1 hypothetical protein LARV_03909 [Longilinea arvoryzae]
MKKRWFSILLAGMLLLAFVLPAAAQTDAEYLLKVNKIMGTNMGSQINGTFKLGIDGDLSVVKSVEFRIDGQAIGTADTAPFTLVFKTTSFSGGAHKLSAAVSTTDGRTLETPARTFDFISGEQAGELFSRVILPVMGIIFGVIAVMMVLQFVVFRNRPLAHIEPGAPRNYGLKGGAICSHCGRPFAIHFWAINLLPTMRYDRCDYCGKWGVQHIVSLSALRAAEQREIAAARPEVPIPEKSEEEKLKEMMDKAKYE